MYRHAVDVVSLVFGVLFGGFTILWVLHVTHVLHHADAWFAGPIVFVAAGAAGLVLSLRSDRTAVDSQ